MNEEIAEKIIKELEKRNWRNSDLARAIGVSSTHLTNWLSYRKSACNMSCKYLIKICEVFEISADYLLGLEK